MEKKKALVKPQPEAAVIIGKQIDGSGNEQRIPQTVEYHKVFAEWDQVVQRQIADPVITGRGHQPFHKEKQQQIDRKIRHVPRRGPFM